MLSKMWRMALPMKTLHPGLAKSPRSSYHRLILARWRGLLYHWRYSILVSYDSQGHHHHLMLARWTGWLCRQGPSIPISYDFQGYRYRLILANSSIWWPSVRPAAVWTRRSIVEDREGILDGWRVSGESRRSRIEGEGWMADDRSQVING